MAVTRERKLEIAERRYQLLTEKYGHRPRGHLSGTRWSSRAAPATPTTSARRSRRSRACAPSRRASRSARRSSASRTSASACPPPAARCSTRVFLYHCIKAGLDCAIVNTEKLARYAVDPRGGAAARRGADLLRAGADPVGGLRRPLPRPQRDAAGKPRAAAARRAARRATSSRARKTGLIEDLEPKLRGGRAARHHQRPADGGHGRGRAGCSTTTSSSSPRCCRAPRR